MSHKSHKIIQRIFRKENINIEWTNKIKMQKINILYECKKIT